MHFIVLGDSKSPTGLASTVAIITASMNKKIALSDGTIAAESKYSRKNLGYLLAMEHGATVIIETDDDNFPTIGILEKPQIPP